jgi:hypothetical protein
MVAAITQEVAEKVLRVVDAGLSKGLGNQRAGEMCVEAAVCYALGLPHGDDPACVSRALRSLKISLNDKEWSSKAARANGLRRLAVAQLGSAGALDDREFVNRVTESVIRKQVTFALRIAASLHRDAKHQDALTEAAARCEKEGTQHASAYASAAASANASSSAHAAYAAAAASAAAYAAAYAADAAYAAASADAAAYAAAYAAKKKRRDEVLTEFAEDVVQILIAMKAPGCQWLALTEEAA